MKLFTKISIKNCHNYLQHENVFKIFLLSYLECHQIWVNIIMDDYPLSIKIEREKNAQTHTKGSCSFSKPIYN